MMHTVLLVDTDQSWIASVEDYLNDRDGRIKVLSATDSAQAVGIVNSNKVDLLITDLKVPNINECELLSHFNTHHPEVPVIIHSALDEADARKVINGHYNYHYLQKPMPLDTLAKEIENFLREDSRGYVHGFTLANFLQLVDMEQKTCTLKVQSNGKVGYLYIQNGEIIEAETNGTSGQEAALRIIGWESAHTQILRFQDKERTIAEPIMRLLLKATSRYDESGGADNAQDLLDEAIIQAEGHHFKQAMALLSRLLKNNPRNHLGWLWYARISGNLKSVRAGLRNAAKLAPQDPEIAEEITKLLSLKTESNDCRIQHCPICWSPIPIGALQCGYCAAHLRVHERVFNIVGSHKEEILDQAAERFERVVNRGKNAEAQYFLAIIRLNQQKWEQTLQHLDTAVKLSPDKPFYSQQLNLLLNHMASSAEGSALEANSSASVKSQGIPAATATEKRNVLVVEDSPTTRKVISITLGQRGFSIIEAADGLEALSKLNDIRPDLVLLDIILPKMDGYKILSIIKSNPDLKNIPVVMLTSKDGILNKVKGKVSGCEAYLTKPFEPNALVETVEKLIAECK